MVNGVGKLQAQVICQRFLKFLIDNLMGGSSSSGAGIKRVTLGAVPGESVEVPIETPSRNGSKNSVSKWSSKSSNGEIVIEFKHIEAENNGPSVPVPIHNGAGKEEQTNHDLPVRDLNSIPYPEPGSDIDKIAENFLETRKKLWQKSLLPRPS